MRKIITGTGILLFLIVTASDCYSQEYRLGGSAIYNVSNKGIGIGARVEFPIKRVDLLDGLSVVPQVFYFPSFNKNTESYVGASVHLGLVSINNWSLYTLGNISYRQWINYQDSNDSTARFSNISLEGGVGITRKTCVRPFLELRMNFVAMEPMLRIGFLYTFNCDRRGMVPCPKIPPPPKF